MNKSHVLYTDQDKDRPDIICDRNGQIALGMCKICGKAEIELDEPCIPQTNPVPDIPFCEDSTIPVCPNCGEDMVYNTELYIWHCTNDHINDWKELINLNKRLLAAAEMLMKQQNLVNPFFSIVKDHHKLISKYNLL